MTGPIIRILLRIVAGILIGRGWLTAEDGAALSSDPDLIMLIEGAIGAAIWAGTEVYYYLAKRFRWAT